MNHAILGSVMITSLNGGYRIAYNYDVLDEEGNTVATNKRQSFYAVDADLKSKIDEIRDYILARRVNE